MDLDLTCKNPCVRKIVRQLCTSFGVRLTIKRNENSLDDFFQRHNNYEAAPFSEHAGIDWNRKCLAISKDVLFETVVHELGHLVASKREPRSSEDFDFLGWEFAVYRKCAPVLGISGLELIRAWQEVSEYAVGENKYASNLTNRELYELVRERFLVAREGGLLGPNLEPLSLRSFTTKKASNKIYDSQF